MGIITGYISSLCLLFLVAKFMARKSKNHEINHFLGKIHKPVSCIFLLSCMIHFILVIPVLQSRSVLLTGSGVIAIGVAILLVILCHTIKDRQNKIVWHRMLSAVLLATVIFHVTTYFIDLTEYKDNINEIEIAEIDLSKISDGIYRGDYDAGYIYAKVQVTIKKGKITNIEILEHRNERGQKAESIIETMINEQKVNVDAVSGATNSSLVIKKACENALCQQ